MPQEPWIIALELGGVILLYTIGFLHVVHALMHVRTAQGTIAWIVSLAMFPFLAIPLYWIAGRRRFEGYVKGRRGEDANLRKLANEMHERLREYELPVEDAFARGAQLLGGLPFTRGNELKVLIDGLETYRELFGSIAKARDYVLVNFYIVNNDRVGNRFKDALIERAKAGVRVYFLFDEIGSSKLSRSFLRELKEAGVEHNYFGTNRRWWSRLQMNFRNHRKIVVVDGREAFLGGLNVGDEYLGEDASIGAWRDTHMKLSGPAVQAVQLVFLEDWYWACGEVPKLTWEADARAADQEAVIIPTGPADPGDSWQLVVAEAANTSRKRLWIASPYFVPDEGVVTALQTASLRGTDVRILLPQKADHLLVWLSSFSFLEDTLPFGVRIFRYQPGFLHQKVMLIDDRLASVGTANLDNRSFRLNFEITALSSDPEFVQQIEAMLTEDFKATIETKIEDFTKRPFWFRAACRLARLMAPLQ